MLEIVLKADDISARTGIHIVVNSSEHLRVYTRIFGKGSHVLHCSEQAKAAALAQLEEVAQGNAVYLEE
jgi:hypothetical protein